MMEDLRNAGAGQERTTAPASRVSTAPHPLAYFRSVIDPFARSHRGSGNQARGDTSM
jgi:hypothetical protein